MQQDKNFFRKKFLNARKAINAQEALQSSDNARNLFMCDIPLPKNAVIAGYHPVNHEISPLPLLKTLADKGVKTALPVIDDKNKPLLFKLWQGNDILLKSRHFNIMEPVESAEIVIPSVIIIPMLAFDKKGHRLGYGGGFYDITLEYLNKKGYRPLKVGLAYNCQMAENLPHLKHDHKMDYIVTESAVIKVKP